MVLSVMNGLKMPNNREGDSNRMLTHGRYIASKRGEPPVSNRIQTYIGSSEPHRKRCAIHALACADVAGERPAATNQKVSGFTGFQALISAPVEKSKAYYFMTYPDSPKKPVLMMS